MDTPDADEEMCDLCSYPLDAPDGTGCLCQAAPLPGLDAIDEDDLTFGFHVEVPPGIIDGDLFEVSDAGWFVEDEDSQEWAGWFEDPDDPEEDDEWDCLQ